MKQIILASSSSQCQELFKKLGIEFAVQASDFDEESVEMGDPRRMAETLALAKAKTVASNKRNAWIVGADTIVVLENEIFGKPKNQKHAREMLKKLNAKPHSVITGFAVYDADTHKFSVGSEETLVHFKPLTDLEIEAYVKSGEPLGKAGGYAIQGLASFFIEKIEGDYTNVVGLPVDAVAKHLADFGIGYSRRKA